MNPARRLLTAPFAFALLLFPVQRIHAQGSLGLSPTQGAGTTEPGRRLTFVCPAAGGANASVFGTDVYTAESGVCAAAIHAGVLKPNQSGAVSILIGTGAKVFAGSTRNGVTTKSYGAWPYSFTFVSGKDPGMISWRTTWSQVPQEFTEPVALVCPPGGRPDGAVWGSDVYARDSSICAAAVHAGVITPDGGGSITVARATSNTPFVASERFGVRSAAWSALPDAFRVMRTASIATAAPVSTPAARTTGAVIPAPSLTTSVTIASSPASAVSTGSQVRNTDPLSMIVAQGTDVVISWPSVPGASWYGVAGASQDLWRQVQPPATRVTYQGLAPGQYTFAVGAYFEPGRETTPAVEWQRMRVIVEAARVEQVDHEQVDPCVQLTADTVSAFDAIEARWLSRTAALITQRQCNIPELAALSQEQLSVATEIRTRRQQAVEAVRMQCERSTQSLESLSNAVNTTVNALSELVEDRLRELEGASAAPAARP